MKKLINRKGKLGAAGLSLVELIISIAILAVVGTAIGGAMYVSSRSYTKGSSEVSVQEEAQVAANLICDWLVDATAVNPNDPNDLSAGFVDSTTAGVLSELWIYHPEGNDEMIIHVYQSGTNLMYDASKYVDPNNHSAGTTAVSGGVLASNLKPGASVGFFTTFGKDRNVRISLDFEVNNRTYHAATDSTSRNHDFVATDGAVVAGTPTLTLDLPKTTIGGEVVYYCVLEPGQNSSRGADFTFTATLHGTDVSSASISVSPATSSGDTTIALSNGPANNVKNVTVGCTDTASTAGVYTFTGTASNGTAPTVKCYVLIRRATKCVFSHSTASVSPSTPSGITNGMAGCVYNVETVDLGVQNGARVNAGKFDMSPYNYQDPSEVKFFYRIYDSASSTYVDASSYVNATEVTSGTPSVQVTLANSIPSDLYVIAVSTHSGAITPSSLNYNVSWGYDDSVSPAVPCVKNKVSAILRGAGNATPNFTYTGTSNNNQAYFAVLKITGGESPYDFSGGGINRNTPAFRIATIDPDYIARLKTRIQGMYSSQTWSTTYSHLSFWNVMYYRVINSDGSYGAWQMYVVSNWSGGNIEEIANSQELLKMTGDETSCFDLDKNYQVKLALEVFYDHTRISNDSSTTTVTASKPYVYDPVSDKFKGNTYTSGNPYVYDLSVNHTGGDNGQVFAVYIQSLRLDSYQLPVSLEYQDSEGNWHTVTDTNITNNIKTAKWMQGSFNYYGDTINRVVLDDAEGTTFPLGGYNENNYYNHNTTVQLIELDNNIRSRLDTNTLYRISYTTVYKEYETIDPGTPGYSNGSTSNLQPHTYHLSDPSGTSGYIYFQTTGHA